MSIVTGVDTESCDLCLEIEHFGTMATGAGEGGPATPFSRLIRRVGGIDVFAGLGSILPGYLLLVPRWHATSMGELARNELEDAYATAWSLADEVRDRFGTPAVLVEHGSSGDATQRGRACIDHAHIHVFPVYPDADANRFVVTRSKRIVDLSPLEQAAKRRRNYYYSAFHADGGFFLVDPFLESQHARRVWAGAVGHPDEWDWAASPFYDNAARTVAAMRDPATMPEDPELEETLLAYGARAEWYARTTWQLAEDSPSRREMSDLADRTEGRIVDAGAGSGRDSAYFHSMGREVVPVDACPELVDQARQRTGLDCKVGDVRSLPFDSDTVGAVWSSAVLLHLKEEAVRAALTEFFRVLQPGGLAQVSVKGGHGHQAQPFGGLTGLRRHFFYYQLKSLAEMARWAGFIVTREWTLREPDSSGAVQDWVKLLLRKPDAHAA